MNDFVLLHPERWWVLLLVPLLILLLVWDRRRRARRRKAYADPSVAPLVFSRLPRPGILRAVSLVLGTALLLFSLLEPSWGRLPLPVSKRAADIVFCLDLSRSMRTKDLPGGRAKRARLDLLSILDRLGGNRVALVGFAKSARVFCPLTHDAKAFRFLLKRAKEDEVEQGPTDLGAALRASLTLLPEAEGAYQAVVLLSDGEDLVQSVDRVVPILVKRGVPLHCIGYGTVQGAAIPDASGMDVLRDEKGKPIISHMDVETLRRLANRTGGTYLSAEDTPLPLVELWKKRILAMQTRETDKGMRTIPISRFQWFLLPGFFLLAFGLRPRGSRNGQKRKGSGLLGRGALKKISAAAFLPLVLLQGGELRKGVELLRKGKAKQALSLLEKARKEAAKPSSVLLLDHAVAAFRAGKTEEAMASAEKLVAKNKALRPERDLIVGTARLAEALGAFAKKDLKNSEQKVKRAIEALDEAVVSRPSWKEARKNLEQALRLLKQIEKIKKQQKKRQKNQKNKNQKQNKDQKNQKKQGENQKKKSQKKEQKQNKKNSKQNQKKGEKNKKSQKQNQKKSQKKKQGKQGQKKQDQPKPKEKEVPKAPQKKKQSRQEPSKKNQEKQDKEKQKKAKKNKANKAKKKKASKPRPAPKPSKGRKKDSSRPRQAIPLRLSPEERAQLEKKLQRLILEARKNEKPRPSRHVPGKKDW